MVQQVSYVYEKFLIDTILTLAGLNWALVLLSACMSQYLCVGWTEFDENSTLGLKSPEDFKYGVRLDVWHPNPDNNSKKGLQRNVIAQCIFSMHPSN